MTAHVGLPAIVAIVAVGCGFAAWGGLALGAPDLCFRLRHLFVLREFELSVVGEVVLRLAGVLAIGSGGLLAGVLVALAAGTRAGAAAGLLALAVGVMSAYVARERWGS